MIKTNHWLKEYNKSRYLRRDNDTLFALQEFIWQSLRDRKSRDFYEELKAEWSESFSTLGSEFPIYLYK